MSDDAKWEFYMCAVGDPPAPASVRVDLALHERLPDDDRPTRIDVTVGLAKPDARGLVGSEEALRGLAEFSDELAAAAAEAGAVHAGSITAQGKVTHVFYGAALDPVAAALRPVLAARVPGRANITGFEDPEWSLYQGFLWPNDLAWGWMRDRDQLYELEKLGDDGTAVREIEHLAYFPNEAARDDFVGKLGHSGFENVEVTAATGDDGLGVRFRAPLAPRLHIQELTESLRIEAQASGGRYNGWGCRAVVVGGE